MYDCSTAANAKHSSSLGERLPFIYHVCRLIVPDSKSRPPVTDGGGLVSGSWLPT
ncbi:hypothetical protein BDZ89DRAFT_1066788 [Hymenopellis radicata]|nr:hypothetical protein BDZ89DRAFT_1066788 [Hymenopellis radicata]